MKESFKIENLNEYNTEIINNFRNHFSSLGYIEHQTEELISSVDNSVRFIGSTTNVFKKYILNQDISRKGFFLIQKCLRTNNSKNFFNDKDFPEWASYFIAMGIIAPYNKLAILSKEVLDYLLKIKIKASRIGINVSSQDQDLIKCVEKLNKEINISIDKEKSVNRYRHKYGIENIYGRNFNFAIKNKNTKQFKDIGNVVLIEKKGKPLAVEMGFGVSTLLARIFSLHNSIESSRISSIVPFKEGFYSKFSDALSATIIMLKEGVAPGSRDKSRILRTYISAISYFREKLGIDLDEIRKFSDKYEKAEFSETSDIGKIVVKYLEEYEETL